MRTALLAAASTLLALPALAHTWDRPASLVDVDVRVAGRGAPLYPAPDGSGRLYVEARPGAEYDVVVRNRSAGRVGVVLVVDGLNVVSGERAEATSPRNRMYVLDPWGEVTVSGWRTSLSEVRRFTFVDERASYAVRSGKANGKLGWIEVAAFRERQLWTWSRPQPLTPEERRDREFGNSQDAPPPATAPGASAPEARGEMKDEAGAAARSYPGTGWGERRYDPAQVVLFDPMPNPAQVVNVRYEYAPALRALGVLPPTWPARDRLLQRERAEDGFAQPPAW